MSLRINTNVVALTANRNLQLTDQALNQSLERLSSGLRINKAADDAAGLAISDKFQAQINGLSQATSNAQDGISLLQTADGALAETTAILQRMRQLAVQAANDTMTASDRSHITDEMNMLSAEVDRIAHDTQFNTQNLLTGGTINTTGITFQIGANADQVVNVSIGTADASALGVLTTQISVDNAADASNTIANLDNALSTLSGVRSRIGAMVNRLQYTISNLSVENENMSSAQSQIKDLDMASEVSNLTRAQILEQSSTAMLAQANQAPQQILSLLKGG